jgi:DNA-binding CsgD family transcriptional regulator
LVRALAVLGDEGDPLLLAELTGIAPTRLTTVHEGLQAAGLAEVGSWRLIHPVVGRAALATTRAGTLERLHAGAARGLVERHAPPGRIAQHLLRCPPAADPEASATLRAAAEEAAGHGDPGLAAACLERALLERAPEDDRAAMLAQLGALRFHAGDGDARARLHQGMAESDDEAVRVELLTRLSALELVDPRDRRLEQHLPAAGEAGDDLGLAAELAALDALIMRPGRHAERARRTRALDPEATGDAELRAAALAHRAWLAMETGDLPAGRTAELAGHAVAGDVLLETAGRRAAFHLAIRALVYADDLDAAGDAITRLRSFAAEQGSVRLETTARWYAAELALRAGRLADAEREARGALATLDDGDIMGAGPLEILVAVLAERGELDAADHELAAREALWREPNGWEAGVRHARARVLLGAGRYAEAEAQAREVGDLRAAQGRPNPSWTPWRSALALALAHQGRLGEAASLADEELGLARAFEGPVAIAVAEHARCVAEPDPDERVRRAAAALDAPIPAPLARARLELELGAALVRLRRRTEGREPLRSALALADAVGAAPLAQRARRELVASGARPRRAALAGARALTPRQRQIAELAAAGRTNREIAEELFLSVKTVETHLAAAFEKLAISERGELPHALGDGPGTARP